MKKELTRAELIEIGKKNEKPYGLMIKEYPQLKEIFEELSKKTKLDYYAGDECFSEKKWGICSVDTYRINPDYTENPQGIELECSDAFVDEFSQFYYKTDEGDYFIKDAILQGAIGFMFEGSEQIYNYPIGYKHKDDSHIFSSSFIENILSGEVTPVRANKVVFIKERSK